MCFLWLLFGGSTRWSERQDKFCRLENTEHYKCWLERKARFTAWWFNAVAGKVWVSEDAPQSGVILVWLRLVVPDACPAGRRSSELPPSSTLLEFFAFVPGYNSASCSPVISFGRSDGRFWWIEQRLSHLFTPVSGSKNTHLQICAYCAFAIEYWTNPRTTSIYSPVEPWKCLYTSKILTFRFFP